MEGRLQRDYQARLNPDDRLYSKDELIERSRGAQAILPCHTEHLSADVIQRLPADVRIIANFSVGYDHVDVDAARARGIVVTNTPDVLSDATAELDHHADDWRRPPGRRGREAGARAAMEGLEPRVHGRHAGHGQAAGHHRHGPRGPRRGAAGARIRHADPLPRPPAARGPDEGVYHDDVEGLLPHCDFLSLNCNVTPATRG